MSVYRPPKNKVGFKPVSVLAQLGKEKLESLSVVRAREEAKRKMTQMTFATNGRKPFLKTVVETKVHQLREKLDPKVLPYFDEMLVEIRKSGGSAMGDISSNVVRKLKRENPSGQFMTTKVDSLFTLAKKEGVIKVE